MSEAVSLPLWLVVIMALAAIVTIYRNMLVPISRMYLIGRERSLNERLTGELSRKLPEVLRVGRHARIEFFINSPEVRRAIDEAIMENQGTREVLEVKVKEYASELTPGFYALFYFRFGYMFARAYIRLLYDLRVAKQPPAAIEDIPESASIVLVANHRSNIDVMLLCYLASRTNMISFAAGEWAKVWPMSTLTHLSGSYIIRRYEPLPLYRKILALHMRNMVKSKMPQGIFLEGGLTRDGSMQAVKLGLLSYILSAIDGENVGDIVFVPVAFNYDQVPEDSTLLKHQDKGFKGRSKIYTVFSTIWSLIRIVYGRMRRGKTMYGKSAVSFGDPVSMNDWLVQKGIPRPLNDEQKREIVSSVADDLIVDIKAMIPVLPLSLIATVFVNEKDSELTATTVYEKAAACLDAEIRRHAVLGFSKDELGEDIELGLEMLTTRKVLVKSNDAYRANSDNEKLLYYLHNSTKHLLGI